MIRAGIDTGGTFTDIAISADGELSVGKVPTTPDDPSQGSADGLSQQLAGRDAISILGLGTTIATNASSSMPCRPPP